MLQQNTHNQKCLAQEAKAAKECEAIMGHTWAAQPEDIMAQEQSHEVQPPQPHPAQARPAPVPTGAQQPLARAVPSTANPFQMPRQPLTTPHPLHHFTGGLPGPSQYLHNPSQMPRQPLTTPHPLHHFTGGLPGPSQYPHAPPLPHALHSNPASPSGFPYSIASHPHLPLGPYGTATPPQPYVQFPMAGHNHFHFPPRFFPLKPTK